MPGITPTTIDLSTRKGYNIAAAIRGPDFKDGAIIIKYVFTARIRWLAGARSQDEWVIGYDSRNGRVDAERARALQAAFRLVASDKDATRAFVHYLAHAYQAAAALGDDKLAELASSFLQGKPLSTTRIIELAGGE